jgi:hypothetical protein
MNDKSMYKPIAVGMLFWLIGTIVWMSFALYFHVPNIISFFGGIVVGCICMNAGFVIGDNKE